MNKDKWIVMIEVPVFATDKWDAIEQAEKLLKNRAKLAKAFKDGDVNIHDAEEDE